MCSIPFTTADAFVPFPPPEEFPPAAAVAFSVFANLMFDLVSFFLTKFVFVFPFFERF